MRTAVKPDGSQRTPATSPWAKVVAIGALVIGVVLTLYPGVAMPGDRFQATDAWASSRGSAEVHWYDEPQRGSHDHVVFFDVGWNDVAVFAEEGDIRWWQTLTLEDTNVRVHDIVAWSSDLPGSFLEHRRNADGGLVLTVGSRSPADLTADRTYRTQIVLRTDVILDGSWWTYAEHVGPTAGPAYAFSIPVRGRAGVCSTCLAEWDRT
jgi:hypothetical protein